MAELDRRVRGIRDEQWAAPTPCSEWTVTDLLNHLVAEQLWVPLLLGGATIEEVGDRFDGDQLGTDPKGRWGQAARAARAAWTAPGALQRTVHLSFGDAPAEEYGWQMTLDLAVHGWDLARAIGADERIDPALASALLRCFEPQIARWQGTGLFASPVPLDQDADGQDRLLAMLGRDPR